MQLSDAVKRGAGSLGSTQPDSQVMVMNAVKDVAAALAAPIDDSSNAQILRYENDNIGIDGYKFA